MRQIRIVEQNPQPAAKAPIPGVSIGLKFSQQSAQVARYETMALPRPIEIKSGRVTIFARPDILAAPSVLTLEAPRPGSINSGGDDESVLEILSLTAHQHTVTASAGGGKAKVATFSGIGSNLKLIAFAGVWYVVGLHGVKLV